MIVFQSTPSKQVVQLKTNTISYAKSMPKAPPLGKVKLQMAHDSWN